MIGKEIASLIYDWADKQQIHPDDFDVLWVNELLERLEENGEELIPLIHSWAEQHQMDSLNLEMLFVKELLEQLEQDE